MSTESTLTPNIDSLFNGAYYAMGLNQPRRTKRRLPTREPLPLVVAQKPNLVWSADFVSGAPNQGLRFRLFNVIDDHNRESVAIEVDTHCAEPA